MALSISFRTLKGDKFKLEALPSETVAELKKKVVARYEDAQPDAYRLIYKGKILDGSKTLGECGITESGFIVVMPPKQAAKPKSTATASQPKEVSRAAPAGAPDAAAAPASDVPSSDAAGASQAASTSTNALVTGQEYSATIKRITEMGFPEADVKKAMAAAFNNPDRAVDYLFNGIPPGVAPTPPAPPSTPPQGAAGSQGSAARETRPAQPGQPFNMFQGGGDSQSGNLDFLRGQEPFNQIRRLIQTNPQMVPQILRQFEQADPALMQLINNNREEFLRLLNEPVEGDGGNTGEEAMNELAQQLAASGGAPPAGTIHVTEEENEVIQRLTELGNTMGLEQISVVQAWLACEKDENLAANYLLNHGDELRAQQAEETSAVEEELRNRGLDGNGEPRPPGGAN